MPYVANQERRRAQTKTIHKKNDFLCLCSYNINTLFGFVGKFDSTLCELLRMPDEE